MEKFTLLVTIPIESPQRQTIESELPPEIDCQYLQDIDPDRRAATVAEANALLSRLPHQELEDEEFARLRADQIMQATSAGVDHLPLDRLPDGLVLQSNAGAHAEPVAEHVLAMYLALSKRLRIEHQKLQDGEFDQFHLNRQVDGSTCGILGFGGIGQASARLLKSVGVSILAINRSGEAEESADFLGKPDDLDYVLRQSDGLVITAPLTPETRGIIDRDSLRVMADDAMLINVARGGLIDQSDLYHHLTDNPEFQAGIDGWWKEPVRHGDFEIEYPFLELPNVIGSPHNAAQVPDISEHSLKQAVRNVATALTTDEFTNVVDRDLGY
jgi:phosphoglycerate dehydrogenase-like enzyme